MSKRSGGKRPGASPRAAAKQAPARPVDPPKWRSAMAGEAKKATTNRLMALGGAVVLMVYGAGYSRTEADARQAAAAMAAFKAQAANTIAPPTSPPAGGSSSASSTVASSSTASGSSASATAPSATPPSATAPSSTSSTPAASSTPASPTGTAPAKAAYKDGTYSAIGWGLHGPIQVGVVVSGGKIASANITGCGTTYSCGYMSPLVAEVVSGQGPPVDYVSGATASSIAYYEAVVSALKKAH